MRQQFGDGRNQLGRESSASDRARLDQTETTRASFGERDAAGLSRSVDAEDSHGFTFRAEREIPIPSRLKSGLPEDLIVLPAASVRLLILAVKGFPRSARDNAEAKRPNG